MNSLQKYAATLGYASSMVNVQSVTLVLAARDVTYLDLVVLIGGMPGRNLSSVAGPAYHYLLIYLAVPMLAMRLVAESE